MAIRVVNLIGDGEIVKKLLTLRIDYLLSSVMGGDDVQFWYAIF